MKLTDERIKEIFDNYSNKMSDADFDKYIEIMKMLSKENPKALTEEFTEIVNTRNAIEKIFKELKSNFGNKSLQEIEAKVGKSKPVMKMSLEQYSLANRIIQEIVTKSNNKVLLNDCYDLLDKSSKKQANLFLNKEYIKLFNKYLNDCKKGASNIQVKLFISKMKLLAKTNPSAFFSEFDEINYSYRYGFVEKGLEKIIKSFEDYRYTGNEIEKEVLEQRIEYFGKCKKFSTEQYENIYQNLKDTNKQLKIKMHKKTDMNDVYYEFDSVSNKKSKNADKQEERELDR